MGGLFSALVLNVQNAATRQITLDSYKERFDIGNLYVVIQENEIGDGAPDPKSLVPFVGYLYKITTNIRNGVATSHSLEFIYVRDFGFHIVSGGSGDASNIQDLARLYCPAIPPSRGSMANVTQQQVEEMIAGQNIPAPYTNSLKLSSFFKIPASTTESPNGIFNGDQIRAMKILPSIMDLQDICNNNPSMTNEQASAPTEAPRQYATWKAYYDLVGGVGPYYFAEEVPASNGIGGSPYIQDSISAVNAVYGNAPSMSTAAIQTRLFPLQNYGAEQNPMPTQPSDGAPSDETDVPQYELIPNLAGLKTPFFIDHYTNAPGGEDVLTKRMVQSLFLIDTALKVAFPMFHNIAEADFSPYVGSNYPVFIGLSGQFPNINKFISNQTPTLLQAFDLPAINIPNPQPLEFQANSYFSIPLRTVSIGSGTYALLPPGTIFKYNINTNQITGYATINLSATSYARPIGWCSQRPLPNTPTPTLEPTPTVSQTPTPYTLASSGSTYAGSQYIYLGPNVSPDSISSGGVRGPVINSDGTQLYYMSVDTTNERVFFCSPYFEWNIERFESLDTIIARGVIVPSQEGSGANENAQQAFDHVDGRAVDIIAIDKAIPTLIPGVFTPNFQLYEIHYGALGTLHDILVKNSDSVITCSNDKKGDQDSKFLYYHVAVGGGAKSFYRVTDQKGGLLTQRPSPAGQYAMSAMVGAA
jgi:hypothetical protein